MPQKVCFFLFIEKNKNNSRTTLNIRQDYTFVRLNFFVRFKVFTFVKKTSEDINLFFGTNYF